MKNGLEEYEKMNQKQRILFNEYHVANSEIIIAIAKKCPAENVAEFLDNYYYPLRDKVIDSGVSTKIQDVQLTNALRMLRT